jgi:hypothetical protein
MAAVFAFTHPAMRRDQNKSRRQNMHRIGALAVAALVAGSLAACDDHNGSLSAAPGGLIGSAKASSLSASGLSANLNANTLGQQILAVAGAPSCGVDFYSFQYTTVGATSESATASGAIMAPTGAGCTGPRPILLYAHGTAVTKAYNIADIADSSNEGWPESALMAAFFAAHGYIVVASNYAGYDTSSLSYHPYLNADQQSKDVINALAAARSAIGGGLSGDTDNGKLFLTGYSQGGFVAMAAHRAMQAQGMTVTAAAPMSGPYAILSQADAAVTYSSPSLGSTIYYPYIIDSYQHAYGNIYASVTDVFSPTYATGIDTLIPGAYTFTTLFTSGKLPEFAVFNAVTPGTGNQPSTGSASLDAAMAVPDANANPIGAMGFGNPYLVLNTVRVAYALDSVAKPDGVVPTVTNLLPPASDPAYPLRLALKKNDLRGWTPTAHVMLCGGMNDPEVFYQLNTLTMAALWTSLVGSGQVTVVDADPTTNGNTANAGQIATDIGTIAAGVYATEPAASAGQINTDVNAAIVSNAAFSGYFTSGQPNSPQGVMLVGIAGVAAAAAATDRTNAVASPVQVANDVGAAVIGDYHFPLTQVACESAAQAYFAGF